MACYLLPSQIPIPERHIPLEANKAQRPVDIPTTSNQYWLTSEFILVDPALQVEPLFHLFPSTDSEPIRRLRGPSVRSLTSALMIIINTGNQTFFPLVCKLPQQAQKSNPYVCQDLKLLMRGQWKSIYLRQTPYQVLPLLMTIGFGIGAKKCSSRQDSSQFHFQSFWAGILFLWGQSHILRCGGQKAYFYGVMKSFFESEKEEFTGIVQAPLFEAWSSSHHLSDLDLGG